MLEQLFQLVYVFVLNGSARPRRTHHFVPAEGNPASIITALSRSQKHLARHYKRRLLERVVLDQHNVWSIVTLEQCFLRRVLHQCCLHFCHQIAFSFKYDGESSARIAYSVVGAYCCVRQIGCSFHHFHSVIRMKERTSSETTNTQGWLD